MKGTEKSVLYVIYYNEGRQKYAMNDSTVILYKYNNTRRTNKTMHDLSYYINPWGGDCAK